LLQKTGETTPARIKFDAIAELDPKKRASDQLGFDIEANAGKVAKEMKLSDI